jgi:A/G-specific adenine glycosylase
MQTISSSLITWFEQHKRDLPWRHERTAWRTLLSEVMLQQTRVDQALPYFEKFISRFPTIADFAKAEQDEILLLWEGLGYYSRARNLHKTTQLIVEQFDNEIPGDYESLLKIKGIGPYTAAAVSSLVFNEPRAVVDGNVIRVLSRFYGIDEDVQLNSVRKRIQEYANSLLDKKRPGLFNEAVMELGATICKPKKPQCFECPLQVECLAFAQARSEQLPYKAKKVKVPHHQIGIGVIYNKQGEVLIAKRPDDKMLGGLWEFPGGKQEKGETIESTIHREFEEEIGIKIQLNKPFKPIKHAYSHFKITLNSWSGLWISGEPKAKESSEIRWIPVSDLPKYAFPKANRKLIEQIQDKL